MPTALGLKEESSSEGILAAHRNWELTTQNDGEKVVHEEAARDEEVHVEEPHDTQSVAESQRPPPPDGGMHAWLKVFGGFLVYINIWGFTLSYGAFQAYYVSTFLSSSSPSAISWIGTVQAWLLIVVGILSGPLFDLGYFRPMLYVGNFLVVFGIMMLSLCKSYWQVFLAQGVCMGLGAGLLYVPSLALVGIWFEKKRALAMGMVMSGIAVGGVIYIIMFNRLIPTAGFPWSIRAMGFVALASALLSFPALLSGSSIVARPRKARRLFDFSAFNDRLFLIFTASLFTNFLAYAVPYFYIPMYAQDELGTSESTALYLLVISVAASSLGRLGSGALAHFAGSILTWGFCVGISGVLSLAWIGIETEGGFIAFSILWGIFSAALVTLPSAVFANISPDLSNLGTRLEWAYGFFRSPAMERHLLVAGNVLVVRAMGSHS
ncbi:MAG: hypothetical protein M1820_008403 [Bogoriella megaspora]|nr:MAG: hypothetical protein M1820_008403 [Bogoriella megaspora]